jgi:uncharacterized membrane protein
MRGSRILLLLATLLLLLVSIYETWTTGKVYGWISVIAFAILLPYEFARAFPPTEARAKSGKH